MEEARLILKLLKVRRGRFGVLEGVHISGCVRYFISKKRAKEKMEFAEVVKKQIKEPLEALCDALIYEGEVEQFVFFSGVVEMLRDPADEASVIAASIELSRCAFLGFIFSPTIQTQVNKVLDQAIEISTTMSSGALQ